MPVRLKAQHRLRRQNSRQLMGFDEFLKSQRKVRHRQEDALAATAAAGAKASKTAASAAAASKRQAQSLQGGYFQEEISAIDGILGGLWEPGEARPSVADAAKEASGRGGANHEHRQKRRSSVSSVASQHSVRRSSISSIVK